MAKRCDECMYWEPTKKDTDTHKDDMEGKCRRFPPVLNVPFLSAAARIDDQDTGVDEVELTFQEVERPWAWAHPVTFGERWCGEHAPVLHEDE